jgi:capsular exopolysaccharide synthesis family protein
MAAVNLALVMSMSVSSRVLLVDCDLRRPRVHESLGLRVEAGLAEILRGAAELEDALVTVEGTALQVLPVRALPPNPSELLASGRMRELVEKLVVRFDRVIFDLPPMLGLPDAKVVSDLCDGVLFVVRAHLTPQEDVESALEVIDRSRLLGIVLNDADAAPERYGYAG